MTARTWWFTPNIESLDAQAHPVTLLDYKLVYLDTEGKPHPIVEGEGSLVVEQRYEWRDNSSLYEPASFAQERRNLLWDALDNLDRHYSVGTNAAIGISFALGAGIAVASVPNNPPLFLSLSALAGLGWVTALGRIVSSGSLRRNLNEALLDAKWELEAEDY